MKTYFAKPSEVEYKWVVIDAKGVVVGRLASYVAKRLRGVFVSRQLQAL